MLVGGPAGPGGQGGQPVTDTALPQRLRHGVGERRMLGQLAFAERRCHRDDFHRGSENGRLFSRFRAGFPEGAQQYLERLQALGRFGHRLHQRRAQVGFAVEEHLALVREVPEEGALVDAGPGGDLRRRGLVEPAFPVQLQAAC